MNLTKSIYNCLNKCFHSFRKDTPENIISIDQEWIQIKATEDLDIKVLTPTTAAVI